MPQSLEKFNETSPVWQVTSFVNADGTTAKQVFANSGGPARVDAILIVNNDTIAHVVNLFLRSSSANFLMGSISIAAGVGTGGVPAVDLISSLFPAQVDAISLNTTLTLQLSLAVAMTGATTLTVMMVAGAF